MAFERLKRRDKNYDNRINFLIAIVFLFGILIIFKLYNLQITSHELYIMRADDQHQIYNKLEPQRGEIFIASYSGGQETLYPFATNKDFAIIYAIPREIEAEEDKAKKIFEIFDRDRVVVEVAEYFEEKDKEELEFSLSLIASLPNEERIPKEAEIKHDFELLREDATWLELRALKKEEEIEKRQEKIIKEYSKKIKKRNDPYEEIQKKVDEKKLKEFYALLLSNENNKVATSSLTMKEGAIFQKTNEEEPVLVKIKGIAHLMKKYRYYPEGNIGSHILGFVSTAEEEAKGIYGLEGFFNKELSGQPGFIKSGRGAIKQVIIVNDREYVKPQNGNSLILTIDRSIQFVACGKLKEAAEKYDIDGGSVVIMDPKTGAIIAMCSWPDFDPNNYSDVEEMSVYNNPVVFDQYEPGSVFKTIAMAPGLDKGEISPNTIYNDKGSIMIEGWPRPIRNSDFESRGGHGMVDMNYALVQSLNTGAIFAMKKVGAPVFASYVKDFGFGERTGIELESENTGDISSLKRKKIRPVEAATASFGQGITVTPLQMLNSYAAIVNNGILMKPFLVKEIMYEDGTREVTKPIQIRRVVSEEATSYLIGMMANVVEEGHASLAGVKGYFVGGKTGTAQVASKEKSGYSEYITIHNFVGFAPVDDPRFVMLVKLDNPKGVAFSASSAAPLFGQIAEFILKYYEIPKER